MFDDLTSTENKGCLWWLVYSVVCIILAVGSIAVLGLAAKVGIDFVRGESPQGSLQDTLDYLKNASFGSEMKKVADFLGLDKENK